MCLRPWLFTARPFINSYNRTLSMILLCTVFERESVRQRRRNSTQRRLDAGQQDELKRTLRTQANKVNRQAW